MSNIFGEKLDESIQRQIEIRQKIYGSGYAVGSFRSSDQLVYLNGNTSWCKLISSVNKNDSNELAKKYKLFNGIGLANSNALRGGITSTNNIDSDNAYGIGGNDFGINPMMGIVSATVNYEHRGSIRKANIKIKAFNKNQFDIIDTLYLRLGFTMLLEWGHSMYYVKDENGNEGLLNVTTTLDTNFLEGEYTYSQFLLLIESFKIDVYQGNYDAMIGRVSNFDYNFNKDGSYDIDITLVSLGDVIESLRCNSYIPSSTSINTNNSILRDLNSLSALTIRLYESTNTIAAFLAKGVPEILTEDALKLKRTPPYWENDKNDYSGRGVGPGQNPSPSFLDIDLIENYESLKNNNNRFLKLLKDKAITENQKKYVISLSIANKSPNLLSNNDLDFLEKSIGLKKLFRSSENIKKITNSYSSTPFIVVKYESDIEDQYYVRLGEFLSFLQEGDGGGKGFIIPKVYAKGKVKGESLIRFDITPANNLMYVDPIQVCADPYICFTKRKIKINKKEVEFTDEFNTANEFILEDSKASILDIYINSAFIVDTIKSSTDNAGKLSIFDLLKTILDNVSKSLGGLNKLDIFIDETTLRALIIDKNPYPYKVYKPTIFKVLGYDKDGTSFIKNFNLKTELPSSLSTIITVGAQKNGIVVGENATALSRLNSTTLDRYQYKITNTGEIKDTNGLLSDKDVDDFKKGFFMKEMWGRYKNFLIKLSESKVTGFDVSTFSGQLKDLLTVSTSITDQISPPKTCALFTGFLPFNLSLDIDGLSGMKINQTILVDTDYLPKNYPKYVNFIIKNISHEILNNKWTTKLESFAISSTSELLDGSKNTLSTKYMDSIEIDSNYSNFNLTFVKKLIERDRQISKDTKANNTTINYSKPATVNDVIEYAKRFLPQSNVSPQSNIFLNIWTKEIETITPDYPAGNWIVDNVDVWEQVGGKSGTKDHTHGWSGFLDKSSTQQRTGHGNTNFNAELYKKLKNSSEIFWAVRNLNDSTPVAQSANANDNVYGASVSKVVVAADYFNTFADANGRLPRKDQYWNVVTAIIPSNNTSWKAMETQIGNGRQDQGSNHTNNFSNTKGYNNMKPGISPNLINAVGMNLFWDDISKNKLKGSGVIAKSALACRTNITRSAKYIPINYYVGSKTGLWSPVVHDSGFVGQIGQKWLAITVLTKGPANAEYVALMWGGLFREYYLEQKL